MAAPDKSNDTGSRIKHATAQGFARTVPAKAQLGTPEELQARVGGTMKSLSDNRPSNFRQLGPGSQGGNANDLTPRRRSGNQKYGGDPHGYGV